MLAAWGDSDSEEEQPSEETSHLCLMAKTDEKEKLKELESEVWFSQKELRHFTKENLILVVLEIQEELKELHKAKQKSDEALVTFKENSEWVDNMKLDIQYRLFSLFDDNNYLKETINRLKHDNIILNVELSLMKLCLIAPDSEVPPLAQYPNFEKLKSDLEDIRANKARLEGGLEKARKGKQPVDYRVPDWITKAETKRTEGLGFKRKFQKEKKIIHNDTGNIILEGTRKGNTYVVDLNEVPNSSLTCLSVIENDPLLWHKRFGHASFTLLDKLRSKELVEGLPCIKFLYDKVCDAFVRGK
ncbi:uncharacterized protein LOC110701565 [Chenopodium quinoa]|uniref:uncharacterized protein LOC110701565 n=1 Tax=Chenopodium quinoa TaxID=63459 RepID=UPI000B7844D1|nr:uncharacterized protein LOC110701565 [Chenopodium quinoa]